MTRAGVSAPLSDTTLMLMGGAEAIAAAGLAATPVALPRPRVLQVGGLPGVRSRRLLHRALDILECEPEAAAGLVRERPFEAVLLDASMRPSHLRGALLALEARSGSGRPAGIVVSDPARRLSLPRGLEALVDDVVSGGFGERQVISRVFAALRMRGWMTELSRKNAELEDLYARLEVLAGRMAEELRLASHVQRSLLPTPVQHDHLEVAREFIPVREIGGDYYDFMPLGPHRMALAIGDVMGKGVPAALLAANLKASLRAQVHGADTTPREIVSRVNRLFWEAIPNGLFATLFFAIFDLEQGRLDYVNAGHHYPFVVTPDGTVTDLVEGGTVLGLVEDSSYQMGQAQIRPDDLFVFYSDGVTDRSNAAGEMFSAERLKDAAVRSRGDSARITLYSLLGEVQGFSGGLPAEDDQTLIVAKAH
jgi:serine phosphatase RsbU (regulator of sigma subunit)